MMTIGPGPGNYDHVYFDIGSDLDRSGSRKYSASDYISFCQSEFSTAVSTRNR